MKRTIWSGNGYCAVTEDGILVEYIQKENGDQNGSILLGKVDRMMPGMKSAFVDIGRSRDGFLPLYEQSNSFTGREIRSGDKLILQIKKEETGGKGAYLTRDITIPGSMMILMPMNRYIGVSSRIQDPILREKMKETGNQIANGRFGIVLRKAAENANQDAIRREAEEAFQQWQKILERKQEAVKPGTVLFSQDILSRLMEDYSAKASPELIQSEVPEVIRTQLKKARERILRLPCGGNIIIDRCEAMTVIDVNSGAASDGVSREHNLLEVNLEACKLIVQQVRLRNLNGIILVDFIDMDSETDRSLVLKAMEESFQNDRIKTVIHGWTRLGLMEMTRKRTRSALSEENFPDMDGTADLSKEQGEITHR